MTSTRAAEVMCQSSAWPHWGNLMKFMTPEEIEYTFDLWRTMPGYTCFADAVNRIRKNENNNSY